MSQARERIVIIMPSWVGDVVMATPALRLIREGRPNAEIHAVTRPGLEQLLDGAKLVNHLHTADARGLLGPAALARTLRSSGAGLCPVFDTAILLTNSFSTALGVRLARIPCRIGYNRDGRGSLLTVRLAAPRDARGWALIPAIRYYHHVASTFVGSAPPPLEPLACTSLTHAPLAESADDRLELGITTSQQAHANELLAGTEIDGPYAILNPGGNNPAKRWPAERFSALADELERTHGLRVLINGSPNERALCEQIARDARTHPIALPALGPTLGSLKAIIRGAQLMVTNDTGPRHIAAAFGVPLVTLFGPTDPRWTTIPVRPLPDGSPSERILIANMEIDPSTTSNQDPARSNIERITPEAVSQAVTRLLNTR